MSALDDPIYEVVRFVDPSMAIAALEEMAVECYGQGDHEGEVSSGILRRWRDSDTVVGIYDTLTDQLVVVTDIRNFKRIDVP